MGSRDYIKLLLGLATAGWRPADPGQFAALLDRSFPLMGYMQAFKMSQLAWALAHFGMPVSPQWAKVGLQGGYGFRVQMVVWEPLGSCCGVYVGSIRCEVCGRCGGVSGNVGFGVFWQ